LSKNRDIAFSCWLFVFFDILHAQTIIGQLNFNIYVSHGCM
jgi:hypothetical protein